MNISLQDLLFNIPLSQLTFFTSLPREPVHYETIVDCIPEEWLERPTLFLLNLEEWNKFEDKEKTIRLIQDPNIVGIVICDPIEVHIQEELYALFLQCQLPIIQLHDSSLVSVFQQKNVFFNPYSQISIELQGFLEKGFINIASQLSKALDLPFLYLDHNDELLWQTGEKEEMQEGNRWLNIHYKKFKNENHLKLTSETRSSFKPYFIQISESTNHTLLTLDHLVTWQKRMVDKLVGLTSLSLQTEAAFQEQQALFKEYFIYDLLFHKFESKRVMIRQGKTWRWNLERPHHLLILNIELDDELMSNINWLEEIVYHLETEKDAMREAMIVFSFQDEIIILLEDDEERIGERKNYVFQTVSHLEELLSNKWSNLRYNIGIGKWYQDTINLNKSYQEAKLALRFGKYWFGDNKKVFHINDLGILRLLIHIHHELLFDFSEEYIAALIERDREKGTEYIKTLEVYIQYQGRVNEVSDALYIHPNTLRNRLKKIEDITGLLLQDTNDLMNLTLAVRIFSFIHS